MVAKLRAVGPDEPVEKQRPKTTVQAAESDDRLAELRAMRARIARAIDDPQTPARDLASLTRRQMEIGREVEALKAAIEQEAAEHGTVEDEAWDETAI